MVRIRREVDDAAALHDEEQSVLVAHSHELIAAASYCGTAAQSQFLCSRRNIVDDQADLVIQNVQEAERTVVGVLQVVPGDVFDDVPGGIEKKME